MRCADPDGALDLPGPRTARTSVAHLEVRPSRTRDPAPVPSSSLPLPHQGVTGVLIDDVTAYAALTARDDEQ
ncbi:hypothetical protein GCM10010980_05050 [Corynebacterium marinum]|nr:hypothetical protein GCM10010980_05050 [Corynebacterium marinum]